MNVKVNCAGMIRISGQDLVESARCLASAFKWRAIALPVGPGSVSHQSVNIQVCSFEIFWILLMRFTSCCDVFGVSQITVKIPLAVVSHPERFDQRLFHGRSLRCASTRLGDGFAPLLFWIVGKP